PPARGRGCRGKRDRPAQRTASPACRGFGPRSPRNNRPAPPPGSAGCRAKIAAGAAPAAARTRPAWAENGAAKERIFSTGGARSDGTMEQRVGKQPVEPTVPLAVPPRPPHREPADRGSMADDAI